jgi:hypothetical protein
MRMNVQGFMIGGAAFITIGLFHPVVITAEYHYGAWIWPGFHLKVANAETLHIF